uniref:hypothetical protein n=1 Tax=Dissulfurimicrobium sp. TaxID=2022436 RepID=UPI0040492C34
MQEAAPMPLLRRGPLLFGPNCERGVKATFRARERLSSLKDRIPLSAFPNAGLPEIVEH